MQIFEYEQEDFCRPGRPLLEEKVQQVNGRANIDRSNIGTSRSRLPERMD